MPLGAEISALATEAATEIARFDAEFGTSAWPLLRCSFAASQPPHLRSGTSLQARGRSHGFSTPWSTCPWLPGSFSLATSNAQHAIDRLVDDGVLRLIGKGARDRVWEAPEVISALERFAKRAKRRSA
jgi:hypothetical protein